MAIALTRRLTPRGRGLLCRRPCALALILSLGAVVAGAAGPGWAAERVFVQRLIR